MQAGRSTSGPTIMPGRPRVPLAARFVSQCDRRTVDECWPWLGAVDHDGYGVIMAEGTKKQLRAHRVAWVFAYGDVPNGLIVCHSCDCPACVNPVHLLLGTHGTNAIDRVGKQRGTRGMDVHTAKLTEDDVRDARCAFRSSRNTTRQLADRYGITYASMRAVLRGRSWRHLPDAG